MTKPTTNPFKFGDPVEGDYYFPRPELRSTIRQFLENRIHVVLIGPRRYGKTSFVLDLFHVMEKEGYTCLLIDIFNITSHKDFLNQALRSIAQKGGFKSKVKAFKKELTRLMPKISLDLDQFSGAPSIGLGVVPLAEEDIKAAIQDIFDGLASMGKKVVVAIDEFQQISQIGDNGWLEATVRTHFQSYKNVSCIFTGSRKSLISEMLNDPRRPLYRSCQVIDFPSFGNEFTDWILTRFKSVSIDCDRFAIDELRKLVQDTPNYVQMLCFHLVLLDKNKISIKDVREVLDMVARQNSYGYQTLLNSLSLAQQRTLRLAANEKQLLFKKELLLKYEIVSAPALYSSIKALKAKGLLDEEGTTKGRVIFDDPMFAYWLSMTF